MSRSRAAEKAPRILGSAGAWLRLSRAYLSCNLQAAMEYRANFLLQVFGMMLNNAAFIVFWKLLIARAGPVAGYGFDDIMFLWALSSGGFGLAHIVFGNVRFIGKAILSGDLDVYLLQPRDVLLNAAMSRMQVSAWGDFLYGVVLMAATQGADPLRWILFLLFLCSAALIFASSFALVESLHFFLGNAQGFSAGFLDLIITSTLYPDRILGPGARWILYSVLPAGFIVFLPLSAFRGLDPLLALAALGASLGYAALAWLSFKAGLKRYESGNLIGTRV